jgi:hypothetical protein
MIYLSKDFLKIYNSIDRVNFRYLEYEDSDNVKYVVLKDKDIIVGILKEKIILGYKYENYIIEDSRTIMYISINKQYQNRGYSKILLNNYFLYLMENNYNKIYLSPYSKMGYMYLRNKLHNLAKEFNIELVDTNYCYEN